VGVHEDVREGAGGPVEGQVMANAEAIHPGAEKLAVAVVAHLAEDAGFEAQDSGPSEMVQDQPADLRAFDGGAGGVRAEQNFFVGADYARGAIEQVNDHAPASDDVEIFFSEALSDAMVGRQALAPRLKVHAMRNSSIASEYNRINSPSPERQTCHARCHSRGIALAGPATTP